LSEVFLVPKKAAEAARAAGLSPRQVRAVWFRAWVYIILMRVTEYVNMAGEYIRSHISGTAVEWCSMLCAFGFASSLYRQPRFFANNNYTQPIEQVVGARTVLAVCSILCAMHIISLVAMRDDGRSENAGRSSDDPRRAANSWPVFLLRAVTLVTAFGVWGFYSWIINQTMLQTAGTYSMYLWVHILGEILFAYYALAAARDFSTARARRWETLSKQQSGQIHQRSAA
jgi:hypothetical protein